MRTPLVFIDRVDIFELFEDRAIQAVRALHRLAESTDVQEHFEIEEILVEGQEGERRASSEESAGWWRRIRIGRETDGSFKFEASTDRARAASYLRPAQQGIVDRLLQRASRSTAPDPELSYTLFEHMVPPEFKDYAPERRPLALMLDEKAAAFPWELIHDRYDRGARPLAVETGMIRQLLIEAIPSARRSLATDCALVVGNPVVSDQRFPSLDGAETEARAVAEKLRDRGYSDVALLLGQDADPESVLVRLHEKPWRILHVAAHGVFEFKPDADSLPQTGVVLDDHIVLGPAEFAQLRVVPEVVFINCCHLGQTKGDAVRVRYERLAANVATQLIRMGARAVVAAGWEVADVAARTFAETFYSWMLDGMPFGDAVTQARAHVYDGTTNTWGAYQCYGDPGFTLRPLRGGEPPWRPVAAHEATLAFDAIAKQSKLAYTDDVRREQQRRLEDLISQCSESWLRAGSVCAAIGAAYGGLGRFDEAIAYYDRAAVAEPADVGLVALEQLANLVARSAGATAAHFAKVERLLRGLIQIGETGERYALIGSLEKRRATALKGGARRRALEEMAKAYDKAYEVKRKRHAADAYYPLSNKLAAAVVLSWNRARRGAETSGTSTGLQQLERLADVATRTGTSFWDLALAGDRGLLEALWNRRLDAKAVRHIEEAYRRAIRRGASAKDVKSILDQVRFFEAMLETEAPPAVRKELEPGLRALRESLAPAPAG